MANCHYFLMHPARKLRMRQLHWQKDFPRRAPGNALSPGLLWHQPLLAQPLTMSHPRGHAAGIPCCKRPHQGHIRVTQTIPTNAHTESLNNFGSEHNDRLVHVSPRLAWMESQPLMATLLRIAVATLGTGSTATAASSLCLIIWTERKERE